MAERPSGLHYKEKEILGQNTEKKPFESASRKQSQVVQQPTLQWC